jgi:hypothetical protein
MTVLVVIELFLKYVKIIQKERSGISGFPEKFSVSFIDEAGTNISYPCLTSKRGGIHRLEMITSANTIMIGDGSCSFQLYRQNHSLEEKSPRRKTHFS